MFEFLTFTFKTYHNLILNLRKKCYFDMAFTLFYVLVWHLLAVLVPFETRHIYNFPQDWWRILLSVFIIILN